MGRGDVEVDAAARPDRVDAIAELQERLAAAEALYRGLFENAADAILVADHDARYVDANELAARLLGYTRDELLTMSVPDVVAAGPEWGRQEFETFTTSGGWRGVLDLRRKDGSLVTVESHASTVPLPGGPVHVAILRDVTARAAAERAREEVLTREHAARGEAERAWRRLELVSEISELLAEWTDYPAALTRLAHHLAGRVADVCVIDLVDDHGRVERVAAAHADPLRQPDVDRLRATVPMTLDAHPAVSAIRTGRAQVTTAVDGAFLDAAVPGEEQRQIVRRLGYRSAVSVPLTARGRVVGAATFVALTSGRELTEADVPALEEIARRVAVRVDNARLYAERDEIATALQNALLPPRLPDVAGLGLAARYQTADRGQVGGDFYDAFELPDGTLQLVIGDVCGKGPRAAAVTGLAHYAVRAASLREPRPAQVLRALNEALLADEAIDRFITACCVRLDPRTGRAEVCVAGHPAPLHVTADGSARPVDAPTGLLLGEFDEPGLAEATLQLDPGSGLLLYTDGVLGGGGDVDALARRVDAALPLTARQLADAALAGRLVGGGPAGDDIAVIAVVRGAVG